MITENGAPLPRTKAVLKALIVRLNDEEWVVRKSSAKALGYMGSEAAMPEVLDALVVLLRDKKFARLLFVFI